MPSIFINKIEKKLHHCGDSNKRFILSVEGESPLFIIGLNPSTAGDETSTANDKKELDHTMRKIVGFIERSQKFDSFVMLNLYTQRTKNPKELHKQIDKNLHKENLDYIKTLLGNKEDLSVLAVWGNKIMINNYLFSCLTEIVDLFKVPSIVTWFQIGKEPTKLKHPIHPRNPKYDTGLHSFNMSEYLKLHEFKQNKK